MLNQTPLHLSPPKLPSLQWSPSGTLTLLTNPPHSHAILTPILTPPIPSTPFSIHLVPTPPPPPPPSDDEESNSESDDEDAVPAGVYSLAAKQGIESFAFGDWSFMGVGGRKGGRRAVWCAGGNGGRVVVWEGVGEGWKGRLELGSYLRDGEHERSRNGKLKGRGIDCKWSRPCYGFRRDGWPEGLLAVSNDAGEVVFFEFGDEGIEEVTVKKRHIVKQNIVPEREGIRMATPEPSRHVDLDDEEHWNLSKEESLALNERFVDGLYDYTGHLDDFPKRVLPERLVKSSVEHLTWGPWMEEGEDRWALLACSFLHECFVMKVTMKRDGTVEVTDQRVVGQAWTDKHRILSVKLFDEVLSGYCVLAYAVQMELRVLFIPTTPAFSESTNIITTKYPNTYHEPINAMTFVRRANAFALVMYTHLGNSQIIPFPIPLPAEGPSQTTSDPSIWPELTAPLRSLPKLLADDLSAFQISHDAKYALHNIYGIATSIMGGTIAVTYRTTPDYCLTYTMAAEERTKFIFATGTPPDDLLELWFPTQRTPSSPFPPANPFTLPSESFLLELSYMDLDSTLKFRQRLPRKPPLPTILPVPIDPTDVPGSLARNILKDETLSRVRYRQLINFTPGVCMKYNIVFSEARDAAWREWGVLLYLVINVLSIPTECLKLEPLIEDKPEDSSTPEETTKQQGPNRRCLYALATLALLTFPTLPPLLPLIHRAFTALSLPTSGPEFLLLTNRLAQHVDLKTPDLPALPAGYTPPTAESFVSRYESCTICGDGLLSGDLLIYKCAKRGHRVQRCQMTFLPIREIDVVKEKEGGGDAGAAATAAAQDTSQAISTTQAPQQASSQQQGTGRRECGICGRHVRGVEVQAEGLVRDLVRAWEVCVYCGGLFIS